MIIDEKQSGTVNMLLIEAKMRQDLLKAKENLDIQLVAQIESELSMLDGIINNSLKTFLKFCVQRNTGE